MDIEEIKEYIALFEKSGLTKFGLKKDTGEILLEREALKRYKKEEKVEEKVEEKEDGFFVSSPMVGTFYTSPSPGEKPFVSVGERVKKGDILCIIEAMKVLNEVKAEEDGIIREVLCKNGKPVEFGTVLFRMENL